MELSVSFLVVSLNAIFRSLSLSLSSEKLLPSHLYTYVVGAISLSRGVYIFLARVLYIPRVGSICPSYGSYISLVPYIFTPDKMQSSNRNRLLIQISYTASAWLFSFAVGIKPFSTERWRVPMPLNNFT